jgi:hypothetical protein
VGNKLVGVQLGAHSVFDEGAEHCLDLLQSTAGINAVFVYSHTYNRFAKGRSATALAPDHSVPVRDPQTRRLTHTWVEPHEVYYAGTVLRHPRRPGQDEYADRDVLDALIEPAHRRGIAVYARILEGFGEQLAAFIPNWVKVLGVDVYGRLTPLPCWNNPDYRAWWLSTIEDVVKSYPIDGFQWGAERVGPLSRLLFRGHVPSCFCEHCQARARDRGTDPERARQGYELLYEFVRERQAKVPAPPDGVLVNVLRLLLRYSEILAWEYAWYQAKESLVQQLYGAAKLIRPELQFGLHVDHQQSTYDMIYRAEADLSQTARYCDFVKAIAYHDIAGPRIKHWHLGRMQNTVFGEISWEQSLELFYDLMGYDKRVEPSLEEMDTTGFSPDYVYRLTRRLVEGVGGNVPIYPGIGFDVPWNNEHFPGDPERVYQATLKALEAGASGVVASREYDEMRVDNLKALGRAVRDAQKAGL